MPRPARLFCLPRFVWRPLRSVAIAILLWDDPHLLDQTPVLPQLTEGNLLRRQFDPQRLGNSHAVQIGRLIGQVTLPAHPAQKLITLFLRHENEGAPVILPHRLLDLALRRFKVVQHRSRLGRIVHFDVARDRQRVEGVLLTGPETLTLRLAGGGTLPDAIGEALELVHDGELPPREIAPLPPAETTHG